MSLNDSLITEMKLAAKAKDKIRLSTIRMMRAAIKNREIEKKRGLNDKEIKVSVELPGIDKNDIDVSLARDTLTISGEKRQETEDRGKNYHRMERSYGAFKRSIPLLCDVDEAEVDATFKNGVLTVTLPKVVEGQCRRAIKIKAK